ncbi:MAG: GNAT family N-acetyltransferase, partial [Paludibacteraceae bacterium]
MEITIQQASVADLPLILDVQKRAFSVIAKVIGNDRIQPLRQSLRELQEENRRGVVLKFVSDGQI